MYIESSKCTRIVFEVCYLRMKTKMNLDVWGEGGWDSGVRALYVGQTFFRKKHSLNLAQALMGSENKLIFTS
jgi:hypothetical protein